MKGKVFSGKTAVVILAVVLFGGFIRAGDAGSFDPVESLLRDGRYAEAEAEARVLLANLEAAEGPESKKTVEAMILLDRALRLSGKWSDPETLRVAERAVELAGKVEGTDSALHATGLRNLGKALENKGDFPGAAELHERALGIRERVSGADGLETAESLLDLGSVRLEMGELAEARPLLERARDIHLEILGDAHPEYATSLVALAALTKEEGDYSAARPLLERALEIRRKALRPDHPKVAAVLMDLGVLLMTLEDLTGAREPLEESVRIREEQLGPRHPELAHSLSNLSIVFELLEDLATARKLQERALSIREAVLGPEHPDVAASLNNLGILYWEAGDLAGAKPIYERSLAINEKVLGEDHVQVGYLNHNLGLLEMMLENHREANRRFRKALAILERVYGPENPVLVPAVATVAESIANLGEIAAAVPLAERALHLLERSVGPRDPKYAGVLNLLATFHWDLRNPVPALEDSLRAERILRQYFQNLARDLAEPEALRFEEERISGLHVALSILASFPAGELPGDAAARVWDGVIHSRAMVLDEVARRLRARFDGEDREVARLVEAFGSARDRLARMMVQGPDPAHPEEYAGKLEEARAARDRAERQLAGKSMVYRERMEERRIGLDEVIGALPSGSALVAFVQYKQLGFTPTEGEDRSRPVPVFTYLALVRNGEGRDPRAVPLGSVAEIDELVEQWRREVMSPPGGLPVAGSSAEDDYRRIAARLRAAIWDPVAPHLGGARQVFVVPDGAINLVNLSALPGDRKEFLAEEGWMVHYLSTERDLVKAGTDGPGGAGILAMGGPDFDASPLTLEAAFRRGDSPAGPDYLHYRSPPAACGDFRSIRFDPLPGTAEEVADLEGIWRRGKKGEGRRGGATVTLTGPDASEAAFKEMAPGHRVLHLATHGFFLQDRCPVSLDGSRGTGGEPAGAEGAGLQAEFDNPLLLSGLALAGANRRNEVGPERDGEDGILTAEEIASLDLSGVEWAVLSACETGLGKVQSGEGVLGLRRAFEVAGAGTLIMSLWRVDDETSRRWMRKLYESRRKGLSTVEAVHDADLRMLEDLRKRGRSTHPFYWGGFVAAGDWH